MAEDEDDEYGMVEDRYSAKDFTDLVEMGALSPYDGSIGDLRRGDTPLDIGDVNLSRLWATDPRELLRYLDDLVKIHDPEEISLCFYGK